jgi:hypothetical protein
MVVQMLREQQESHADIFWEKSATEKNKDADIKRRFQKKRGEQKSNQ